MNKRLITAIALSGSIAAVNAQNQILDQINSIKLQSDVYYWGQFAHPNADSARVRALCSALEDVNAGRSDSQKLSISDIERYAKYLPITRGRLTRGFAYIRKADLASATAPAISTPQPIAGGSQQSVVPQPPKRFVADLFVQRIMQQRTFNAVYNYLRSLKADRQIAMFGPLSDVDDYSTLDLILFDLKSKEIITVLSAVGDNGTRTDLTTGTPDALENYPQSMTAVIYYIK